MTEGEVLGAPQSLGDLLDQVRGLSVKQPPIVRIGLRATEVEHLLQLGQLG